MNFFVLINKIKYFKNYFSLDNINSSIKIFFYSILKQNTRYPKYLLNFEKKAGKYLEEAMAASRKVKIPYVEAQVVFELSRFAGTPPHLRNHYRTTAQDLFWRMRSQYFIDQLEAAAKASRAASNSIPAATISASTFAASISTVSYRTYLC